MHIAEITVGNDFIESPIDNERLEGLIRNQRTDVPQSEDLLSLSRVFNNVKVIKCEGRIIFGAVDNENSNEVPISIEAASDIMASSSRENIKIKTTSILDNEGNYREVIKIDNNTLVIPEPDDDGDDEYGIFYFISIID